MAPAIFLCRKWLRVGALVSFNPATVIFFRKFTTDFYRIIVVQRYSKFKTRFRVYLNHQCIDLIAEYPKSRKGRRWYRLILFVFEILKNLS